ncbi:WD40-repeat-containing domain protein [Peziza echinospora]|nr:WD40-repeat-containing domain protein [Peziza echinospora]
MSQPKQVKMRKRERLTDFWRSKSPFSKSGNSSTASLQNPVPMPVDPGLTQAQSAPVSVEPTPVKTSATRETLELIIKDLGCARTEALQAQWRYTNRDGHEVIVVERMGRLLNGIEDYAKIVDVAIQHHPDVTALIWAGVRLILQVVRNRVEAMEVLEWTMATVVATMATCEFYARIYSNSLDVTLESTSTTEAFRRTLDSALKELYVALLVFSEKAKQYFDPENSVATKVGNLFKPFSALMKPFIDTIAEKEKVVQECANMATMERIMRRSNDFERMKGLLVDIKREMAPLTKLDEILFNTQENLVITREIKEALLRLEPLERHQGQILFGESFDSDLQHLKEDYLTASDLMEEFQLDLYVPAQGMISPHEKESKDLERLLRDFLKEETPQKVCIIQGSGGSGKSTFNHHLARQLWSDYNEARDVGNRIIPLFISLASLYRPAVHDQDFDLIAAYFQERDFTEEQIKLARRTRQFVFLLDGYDEISKRDRNFYAENKLGKWKAKVIITTRPEYLDPGYQSKFFPPGQQHLLQEFWLAPFSVQTIQTYIVKYTKAKPEGHSVADYQQMVSHPELQALISNPFLLRMVMTVSPTLGKGSFKRRTLYKQFIDHWLSRAQERLDMIQLSQTQRGLFEQLCHGTFTKHGQLYCEKFAVTLYRQKILEVNFDYTHPDPDSDWKGLLGNDDEKTRLLRFSSPLIRDRQRQSYRFLHKTLRDYLVAQAIWNDQSMEVCRAQALINEFYLVDDPGVIDFIVERAEDNKILQQQLLAYVEQSKAHAGSGYAAANAITILVKIGIRFTGQDLCGIRISGADLSFGWFDRAQLQNADLRQVQLRGTWLRGADLRGAEMSGVLFGERPFFKTPGPLFSCCFSHDGRLLASAGSATTVQLYSVAHQQLVHEFTGHTKSVWSVAFSTNDELLASSDDKTVLLWSVIHQQHVHTFTGHTQRVLSVAFSPHAHNQLLASASRDETVRLWSVAHQQHIHTFTGHTDWVNSVAFSPDGQLLASASRDKTVRLWSVAHQQHIHTFTGHTNWVNSVAFSPDGQLIASASDDSTVRLWSVIHQQHGHTFTGHTSSVYSVAFSPHAHNQLLASASLDRTVRLWSALHQKHVHTFTGHTGMVNSVAFSPHVQLLASASGDCTVRLWSVPHQQHNHNLTDLMSFSVASSPHARNQLLASAHRDDTVRLWSLPDQKLFHTFTGHTDWVNSVAFSSDGQLIASASDDNTIQLWSVPRQEHVHTFTGHTECVNIVAFSSDGQLIASASDDNTIQLWSVPRQEHVHTFTGHRECVKSVAFSPDGQLLASAGGNCTVRLWSLPDQKLFHTFTGHTDWVNSVAFSSDGQLIASASADNTIQLWSVPRQEHVHTFTGHTDCVNSVSFSPDGQLLASASDDSTVRLWSVYERQSYAEGFHFDSFHSWTQSVAWANDELLATCGGDGIIRVWQLKRQTVQQEGSHESDGQESQVVSGLDISCKWASAQSSLVVGGLQAHGVKGLDPINARLLIQRGAIGVPEPAGDTDIAEA